MVSAPQHLQPCQGGLPQGWPPQARVALVLSSQLSFKVRALGPCRLTLLSWETEACAGYLRPSVPSLSSLSAKALQAQGTGRALPAP